MKKAARYLLLVLVIALMLASCITGRGDSANTVISPDDITATYGAQEFHAQLTAIAREGAAATPTPFLVIFR